MEKIAEKLTNYIIKKNAISEEDYEIYKYGFLTGMEMILCIATCFIISIQIHMMSECVIFFLIFIALRSFVGGLHMDNFVACYLCSVVTLFSTLLLIKYYPFSNISTTVFIICSLVLIYKINPVENDNRPTDKREKQIFSQRIKQILMIICIATLFIYLLKWNKVLNTIMYTLIVIFVSMILGIVKNKVELKGKSKRLLA